MGHLLKIFWLVIFLTLAIPDVSVSAQDPLPDDIQSQCNGKSQGKHFVLGFNDIFMEGSTTFGLSVSVVALSNQTSVTISSKYKVEGTPFGESFVIEAGGFRRTTIPVQLIMKGNERSFKGIDITASSDVSVYARIYRYEKTGGFLAIPTRNLGTQYVVITSKPSTWGSQFAVIGTQNSTLVQVTVQGTVTFDGKTYHPGEVLRFNLTDLEAVQIQGQTWVDLTGSIIQSDKPVAVFSGNKYANHAHSRCDVVTEQLIPVQSWGQKHIYTAARSDDDNIYRIVAYFSETNLAIIGHEQQSLEPGQFWEGRLSGAGLVTSSKPALMVQHLASINGRIVDPSIIQVPAEEHFDFVFGFTTPPFSTHGGSEGFFNYASIIVRNDERETLFLNGSPLNDTLAEINVPSTDYISLTAQLPRGENMYFIEQTDPNSAPFSVIVYGYEKHESYGYAAGLSLPSNKQLLSLTPYYIRELGGEILTMTIPCLQNNATSFQDATCKFSTGYEDVLVSGERIDSNTVACITPTFYNIQLRSVQVSLDEGESFPYSGLVYAASQEDLPPPVQMQQVNSSYVDSIINLTSDNPIMLSWDPRSLGEGVSHVNVYIQNIFKDSDGNPVLMEGVEVMTDVLNDGYLMIQPTVLESHVDDGLSLQALYLSPSTGRKRFVFDFICVIKTTVMVSKGVCDVSKLQLRFTVPTGLPPCPCNKTQADADKNFEKSNSGFPLCYRSVTPLPNGAGQKCCYGENGKLLVGPPDGGTAERFAPNNKKNTILHQLSDVIPWVCLRLSNNLEEYYKYRPSDDCSKYKKPKGCHKKKKTP